MNQIGKYFDTVNKKYKLRGLSKENKWVKIGLLQNIIWNNSEFPKKMKTTDFV